MKLELYQELYFKLFAAIVDAVESLEQNEPNAAKKRLITAMREAEEKFIRENEPGTAQTMKEK